MERRKFIKYSGFAGLGASLFPMSVVGDLGKQGVAHLIQFSAASTQIRHGALNLPFAQYLRSELPFDWLVDVQQNIFFKNGFQRNEAEDMNVISIALKEGDHFEALQINNQTDALSILWKGQYFELDPKVKSQTVAIQDEHYSFHFLCLSKDENIKFHCQSDHNYFVQVLIGEVENEEHILNTKNGLGLITKNNAEQIFISKTQSKLLIIDYV